MGKYLKMSDVFCGDYHTKKMHDENGNGFSFMVAHCAEAEYATHAINSRDELVAEVERLRGDNDALMKCRMAAREFFNCTVASGGLVKVSSSNNDALDEADKASDWLEAELKATADLVNK